MEGKQEEDRRTSPLDFQSAARADERSRNLMRERIAFTVSPPTIPRTSASHTDSIFFSERNLPTSHTSFSAGIAGSAISGANTPGPIIGNNYEYNPTNVNVGLQYGGSISAFSSSSSRRPQEPNYHGQIPAFHQSSQQNLLSQHQQGSPSWWERHRRERDRQNQQRYQTIPPSQQQNFGTCIPVQGHFFTPVPADLEITGNDQTEIDAAHTNLSLCLPVSSPASQGELSSRYSSEASQSPASRRPPSSASIQSSGSRLSPAGSEQASSMQGIRPRSSANRASEDTGRSSSGRSSRRSRRNATPTFSSPNKGGAVSTSVEDARKSPPPQNLRGDPFRSAKVKTELCRNYMTAKGCPFGDKCNYAHGEHELKFTKLKALEDAGLVDIEIYRTHPCPTWVAVGSCPFDQRCIGLHDPRIESDYPDWLPHKETMINSKVLEGLDVDNFYHERLASVYNHCPIYGYVPLVHEQSEKKFINDASFKHFYEFICNVDRLKKTSAYKRDQSFEALSEDVQLELVLKMREEALGVSYKYMPTHLLNGELCMVLQAKTFQSHKINDNYNRIRSLWAEVPKEQENESCDTNDGSIVKVHEIVFGPVGDPTVRPVSVWFDIDESELIECTLQQAKHHKHSRHRLKKKSNQSSKRDENSLKIAPFDHYQPRDQETFHLITRILSLRLKTIRTLKAGLDPPVKQRYLQELENEMKMLKSQYFGLLAFWVSWSWPDQVLEGIIDENTEVPPVDGEYHCYVHKSKHRRNEIGDESHGLGTKRCSCAIPMQTKCLPSLIWKSCIINLQIMKGKNIEAIRKNANSADDKLYFSLRRLPVFRHLSMGGELCKKRISPHVRNSSAEPSMEKLFHNWELIRSQFQDNIDKISSRRSRSPKKQPRHSDTITKELSQHLDHCAMAAHRKF